MSITWFVDESLLESLRNLAYYKQRIKTLAWEKHMYRHEMIRFNGYNKHEFDRVCRALRFYRNNYKMICEEIHAKVPYR